MFIGLFKTTNNQIAREVDTFDEAWGFLQRTANGCNNIVKAVVLKETKDNYLDDQFPDFNSLEEVASMRLVK